MDIEQPESLIEYLRTMRRVGLDDPLSIKVGSIIQSERLSKYNRLLQIEAEL